MPHVTLDVLYEDNHLLAVNKPAGLPTQGAAADEESLVSLAKDYLKEKYQKPGNVYVGVVSRVDSLVTGVVLLARTSKAAARLTEQFRERDVGKTYWALVTGNVPEQGTCVNWLSKDERRQRMIVVPARSPGALEARLEFRRLEVRGATSLVEIELLTGRKHQIRVQLETRGWPILGDSKYGSTASFPDGIALHARRLVIEHPTRGEPVVLEAPLPTSWPPDLFAKSKES